LQDNQLMPSPLFSSSIKIKEIIARQLAPWSVQNETLWCFWRKKDIWFITGITFNLRDKIRCWCLISDIRPYKCRFCNYYARTNSQLKVHMMRHQGQWKTESFASSTLPSQCCFRIIGYQRSCKWIRVLERPNCSYIWCQNSFLILCLTTQLKFSKPHLESIVMYRVAQNHINLKISTNDDIRSFIHHTSLADLIHPCIHLSWSHWLYCIVLYSYIYIALLAVHTNQKRF